LSETGLPVNELLGNPQPPGVTSPIAPVQYSHLLYREDRGYGQKKRDGEQRPGPWVRYYVGSTTPDAAN